MYASSLPQECWELEDRSEVPPSVCNIDPPSKIRRQITTPILKWLDIIAAVLYHSLWFLAKTSASTCLCAKLNDTKPASLDKMKNPEWTCEYRWRALMLRVSHRGAFGHKGRSSGACPAPNWNVAPPSPERNHAPDPKIWREVVCQMQVAISV